jgi:hypothetical protein
VARTALPLASSLAAAGLAVAAPLVAEVVGFVGAQNPAWIQPGYDAGQLPWGPPTAAHCSSMGALPAVQVRGGACSASGPFWGRAGAAALLRPS